MENGKYLFAQFNDEPSFSVVNEFQFAGTQAVEKDGLITKGILRTGEWPVTPTATGKEQKPLRIIKEGVSSYDAGIIALSDVVNNFGKVRQYVQVPLAQANQKDHINKTVNNTGFVRSVWVEDRPEWGDGQAELMGAFEFTKPEVKQEVINGTYADVSSGVPWFEGENGQSAFLDHVCITNQPFVSNLSGWMFSDNDDVTVNIATMEKSKDDNEVTPPSPADQVTPEAHSEANEFFFGQRMKDIGKALESMNLLGFEVLDISPTKALIRNPTIDDKQWLVTYAIVEGEILLASSDKWTLKDVSENNPPNDDLPTQDEVEHEEVPAPTQPRAEMSDLEVAQQAREQKLTRTTNEGGEAVSRPNRLLSVLEGVELTDEQRAALEAADEERTTLRRTTREGEADARIAELKAKGIKMPGALKLYRKVFFADDGGPAAVLLSDDGTEKKTVKAVEILDLFIDACKGDDGTVTFSDQATDLGNNNPPPKDSSDEGKTLEERTAESKQFLKLDGATK